MKSSGGAASGCDSGGAPAAGGPAAGSMSMGGSSRAVVPSGLGDTNATLLQILGTITQASSAQ